MKEKWLFASHNQHKVEEIRAMLPSSITLLSLTDIGCIDEIPETAHTIEGNALIKAQYIYDKYGYSCFADDTGLEIEALNNEPGVYSARYAGADKNALANMEKVLTKLGDKESRKAHFKTVIALIEEDGTEVLFEGIVEGQILKHPKGDAGFGYDPIFKPIGYNLSFAELTADEKNKISHRGQAVKKLITYLKAK